ncbi:hypothetical protein EUTSA_v10003038mg [Eutrema salsugineum]|uniref:Ubiquitin-like protease family profile domain-containing protein n=1 Tax=Eutrema salsugineum TaxID=72664 RepID=V4L037_EUTSA|nr:hypothetical protein EUTSA_v10003038mg [Eutrema salsugineum]
MKDNVNVGASESVNAPGDAKGKKAAVDEKEAPEASFYEVDPKTCDVDFDAVAISKNSKARAAAQILAATQKSPFLGNSTAKLIIPTSASHSGRVHGYDPFDQTGVKEKHTTLMNFVKSNPRPINSSIKWYYTLWTPKKWLADTHMEAYINLLRLRLSKHPEWFVSDRICFLNSIWRRDYNDFKKSDLNKDGSGKLLPPGAYSYFTGELPIYCQTKKMCANEVDHLYSMLHIRGGHWVAISISFVTRHITIWDSHVGTKYASDAQIDEAVEHLAVMIPYLLQTCAPNEDKWRFPYTLFTHSRCHALDLPFPLQLCDKNIRLIREKMAAEIFDEIGAKGHDNLLSN